MSYPGSPSSLLRADAAVVDARTEADADRWLGEGVHLRVRVGTYGLPLCPFTVWQVQPAIVGASIHAATPLALPDGTVAAARIGAAGSLTSLEHGHVHSRRSHVPMTVATPGQVVDTQPPLAHDHAVVVPYLWNDPWWKSPGPLVQSFGLPFDDPTPWWSGPGPSWWPADKRVQAGRLQVPPYDAAGGLDPVDLAARQAALVDVLAAWSQPPTPAGHPLLQTVPLPGSGGTNGLSGTSDARTLVTGAALEAPGSRWWGLATTLDDLRLDVSSEEVPCVVVAGLFAYPEPTTSDLVARLLAEVDLDTALAADGAKEVRDLLLDTHPALPGIVGNLEDCGVRVVALWTVVPLVPLPDLAPAPAPSLVPRSWEQPHGGPDTWTATLSFPIGEAEPLLALLDDDTGRWRHVAGDGVGDWLRPVVRTRPADPTVSPSLAVTGLLDGTASLEVRSGDQWGRWSPPAVVDCDPPTRPGPPRPLVRLTPTPVSPRPVGSGPAVAATVRIEARLPSLGGGNGALPVAGVSVALTGAGSGSVSLAFQAATATTEAMWVGTTTTAPTTPGGVVTVVATAVSSDTSGTVSSPGTASLPVPDPRPVVVPVTSERLLWTSPRRPDGSCELDLVVASGHPEVPRWRVYVGDEPVGAAEPFRAARSLAVARSAVAGRAGLTALPADAATVLGGGAVRVRAVLPGRLERLKVLQLVPVTSAGVEAAGSDCGVVVVAVPLGDTPPAPRLHVTGGPQSVELRIDVHLPGPPSLPHALAVRGLGADAPLVARIRRTTAGAPFAVAPVRPALVSLSPLPDAGDGWRWSGSIADPVAAAAAWSSATYWAEVAWPDEPAFPAGTVPLASPVSPVHDAQPSAWSAPSNPATLLLPGDTSQVAAHRISPTDVMVTGLTPTPVGGAQWQLLASTSAVVVHRDVYAGDTYNILHKGGAGLPWTIAVTTPAGEPLAPLVVP